MTAGGEWGISVEICRVNVLERIFPAADIERIAVSQKRLAAAFSDKVCNYLGVIGPQKGQVAILAEMQLDGDKLALKIQLGKIRFFQKLAQLVELGHTVVTAKIGKIYFRSCHGSSLRFYGSTA